MAMKPWVKTTLWVLGSVVVISGLLALGLFLAGVFGTKKAASGVTSQAASRTGARTLEGASASLSARMNEVINSAKKRAVLAAEGRDAGLARIAGKTMGMSETCTSGGRKGKNASDENQGQAAILKLMCQQPQVQFGEGVTPSTKPLNDSGTGCRAGSLGPSAFGTAPGVRS
jgi:hypothetical protein